MAKKLFEHFHPVMSDNNAESDGALNDDVAGVGGNAQASEGDHSPPSDAVDPLWNDGDTVSLPDEDSTVPWAQEDANPANFQYSSPDPNSTDVSLPSSSSSDSSSSSSGSSSESSSSSGGARSPAPRTRRSKRLQRAMKSLKEKKEALEKQRTKHSESQAELAALRSQLHNIKLKNLQLQQATKRPRSPSPASSVVAPPRRRSRRLSQRRIPVVSPSPVRSPPHTSRRKRSASPPPTTERKKTRRGRSITRTVKNNPVVKKTSKKESKNNNTHKSVQSVVVDANKAAGNDKIYFPRMVNKMATPPHKSNIGSLGLPFAGSYSVPPIKYEILKVIRKKEFCCFNKLKPKKPYLKSQEEKHGQVDMTYVKGSLKLTTRKADTLQSFPEWMEVWNIFAQAHLHFHPLDAQKLFTYQKNITRFAAKYNFEALYSYDIDFRCLISAEKHLPHNERQVAWDQVNEELVNSNLREHRKPEPSCFHCGQKGHYSNKCPNQLQVIRNGGSAYVGNVTSGIPPLMSFMAQPPNPGPMPAVPRNRANNSNQNIRRVVPNQNTNVPNRRNASNKFCHHFRNSGTCPFGAACVFRHDCEFCGQSGHNSMSCHLHTSTMFRPQH